MKQETVGTTCHGDMANERYTIELASWLIAIVAEMSVDAGLVAVLQGAASADPAARTAAEQQLSGGANQPQFGVLLCQVVVSPEVDSGLKQLAALVLKKYIKEHWDETNRKFQPPVAPENAKHLIRQGLLPGLADDSSKLRTAVGMCIAEICKTDWPQQWPGLLHWLVAQIQERQNPNLGM